MKRPFTDRQTIRAYPLKGLLRGPSDLVIPPSQAFLSQDAVHGTAIVKRRGGAYPIYEAENPDNGRLIFDGTNDRRVEFPDIGAYDLGVKWAIVVGNFRIPSAPGGTQYLFTRDVTPAAAGRKTFAVSISDTRRMGFEMNENDGTSTPLAPAAASAITDNSVNTLVVYRDLGLLAMHLNGDPNPAVTRGDLDPGQPNAVGAQKAIVGLNSNDDGVADFTGLFNGDIGWVAIWQDYTSIADLLAWSTAGPYADPLDPRIVLLASFGYDDESGTVAKDRSYLRNDGTLIGSPSRGAWLGLPPIPTQALGVFGNPQTGLKQNYMWSAGRLLVSPVAPGRV